MPTGAMRTDDDEDKQLVLTTSIPSSFQLSLSLTCEKIFVRQ